MSRPIHDSPLFEIRTMEWLQQNGRLHDKKPHRHQGFEIVWVRQGGGSFCVDLETRDIAGGHVYCLRPGQIHQFLPEAGTQGYVISFSPDFLLMPAYNKPVIFHAGSSPHSWLLKVEESMQLEMEDMVLKMLKEYDNYLLLRSEILRGLLNIFLIYLTRQFVPAGIRNMPCKRSDLVTRFLAIVDQKYMILKLVADYAGELAVTPNHLNEMVKKVSGFPASHHIRQRVVLEAKRQATYSGASMKEIAHQLGFDDIAHFSKFFKNFSGLSFSNYKKEAMQQWR
ncbi:helix-turn-helix transcriptional regulator [Chitinophaga sp.]|uniref:AraC family transcriptional regulator n=1 Tax=Chitinophaga sp. TaxID=1869181 RepID=UPI0031DDECAF